MNRAEFEKLVRQVHRGGSRVKESPCGDYQLSTDGWYDASREETIYYLHVLNISTWTPCFTISRSRPSASDTKYLVEEMSAPRETEDWLIRHIDHFNRWLMNEEKDILPEE